MWANTRQSLTVLILTSVTLLCNLNNLNKAPISSAHRTTNLAYIQRTTNSTHYKAGSTEAARRSGFKRGIRAFTRTNAVPRPF
ncbi:hypothetical protein FKP32DRAFT_895667 [Trametes sanguinea]|nr:hypothetical protein FKP32DRAFT_895667 [Trametes sanguinea]